MINHEPAREPRSQNSESCTDCVSSEEFEFDNSELISIFDRYASALDSGDEEAAEAILGEYPELGDDFRQPLRGLYLLGQDAKQQKLDYQLSEKEERRRLGDFEIESELGRGGMGVVYAATQISLQRPVALKILPFTAVLDPRQVQRFRNEAQAAASLHHPNIVPVFGVGCERGVHYYSMQLIDGQSMEQFLELLKGNQANNHAACDPRAETAENLSTVASYQSSNYVRNVIQVGAQVAEALDFAHEQGIVHRDIKPSNLLLDQSGKIWVADFGLAQCRGNANLTSQGDRLGTARYMSPEQAAGRSNQVDFRTDIYALGITLYEILALRPAFAAQDRVQLLAAIESDSPVQLRKLNPAIPIDLETVIEKATSKDPNDRYRSAQDFADDLTRCFRGEAVQAKRKSWLDRLSKSASKNKGLVTACVLTLAVITMVTATAASTFYHQRTREQVAAENARFYLREAQLVVDRFGQLVSNELQQIPGTEKLQAELIGESIGYYNEFLRHATNSPNLKIEKAIALSQLAQLHEKVNECDRAEQNYVEAINCFGELESNPNVILEKAVCLDRLGLLHLRAGRTELSLKYLELSLAEFAELEDGKKKNLDQETFETAAYAQTIANVGVLHQTTGKSESANAYFQAAISKLQSQNSIAQTLAAHDFESQNDWLKAPELRSAYFKINGAFVGSLIESDLDRAEDLLQKSIQGLRDANVFLELESEHQLVNENLEHIADMNNNLAIVLSKKEEPVEARHYARKSHQYWETRLAESPKNLQFAERLATSLNTLGEIGWQEKSQDSGAAEFTRAEELFREILSHSPARPELLSRLAGVLHNKSLVAYRKADSHVATESINAAIGYQASAIELVPENTKFKKRLKSHHETRQVIEAHETFEITKAGGVQ